MVPPDNQLPLALRDGETSEQLRIMASGQPYKAVDPYLMRLRQWAQDRVKELNNIGDVQERMEAMRGFIEMPEGPISVFICGSFYFEYGFLTSFGRDVYIGPNSTIVDCSPVKFGDRTMVGANCSFYTPGHPTSPEARNGLQGPEWASPITIGNDCWIGGSVVIIGPCRMGDGVTIGAGSVVTRDIPDRCIAVGNPARVIKTINADGSTERVDRS